MSPSRPRDRAAVLTPASPVRSRAAAVLPWVSTVVRFGLAAVLLVAGVMKAVDPTASVAAVRAYALLPAGWDTVVGYLLPLLEVGLGLLLAVGACTRGAAVAAGVLFAGFALAVASAAARGLSIDCGCFGGGGAVAPGQTRYAAEIARDAVLVAASAYLAWRPRTRLTPTPTPRVPSPEGSR